MKLKRSALIHFLDTVFGAESATPAWYKIGKDVEDLAIELNPDTKNMKNILDENTVIDNGYEPSFDVDTYYADPSDGEFYTTVKNIAMNRLTGDECKTRALEVLIDKTEAPYDAWMEDVIVKPQSYGGPQGGVSIPYNVAFCGNRVQGTVTIVNKKPVFVPATEATAQTASTYED